MENYFLNQQAIDSSCLIKILKGDKLPNESEIWEFTNEIKPIDIYCYLYAKYGPPNGLQSFLRSDDSDNLIHWEWALAGEFGITMIQGQNFRSEVLLRGNFKDKGLTINDFISQIKSDIGSQGKKISELRKKLEKWTQFVNPYKRIKSAVDQHFLKLESLSINPEVDKVPQATTLSEWNSYGEKFTAISDKYSYAMGLTFGLRSMLPVLAESFVNLIIFILCRPDIKTNDRLFQSVIRQPIDIRIQSLHINCIGFESAVDYSSDECKNFHTLMNERNDLLHGNVEVNKLSIGDVYFDKNIPLFLQYEDFWDKSIGVSMKSVKFDRIQTDRDVVNKFIQYIVNKLKPEVKEEIEMIMEKGQLGFNYKTGRVGVLFPEYMVDFRGAFKDE